MPTSQTCGLLSETGDAPSVRTSPYEIDITAPAECHVYVYAGQEFDGFRLFAQDSSRVESPMLIAESPDALANPFSTNAH